MSTSISGSKPNVAHRLDRLPISSVHYLVLAGLAFAYFFELGDLNTFAYTAPALIKFWHISVSTVGTITSAAFLGMFVGATCGGWLADRVGRKRGLLLAISTYAVFSLLNALAWNPVSLGIFRFLTGVGLSAMTIMANTYISEFFPASSRGKYQGWTMVFGLIGIPVTAQVARLVIPLAPWAWRFVFIWGGLGVLALILVSRMFESPRWYEVHGRTREAEEVMQQIEAAVIAQKGSLPAPAPAAVQEEAVRSVPYSELFRGRYLGRTILLLIVWIFQTIGFYGFQSWVPTLLVKHGFSLVSSLTFASAIAIGAPFGALLAALIAERLDRKWSTTLVCLTIAAFGLLYGLTFQPGLIIAFGLLVAVFLQTFAALLYAYTPELYPTEARASGHGLTYGAGRLANVFGPLMVSAIFLGYGYQSVFMFVAACWFVTAGTIGFFGPLTRRRSLEQVSASEVHAVMQPGLSA
jgi:putative MFS transporter